MRRLKADFTYIGGSFVPGVTVSFEPVTGEIVAVGAAPADAPVEALRGRALVPGMVNAHSHAFQRAIRGWTQWKPPGDDADFWSWREAMYKAVLRMSPDDVYEISRFCFAEMLLAGYTTVGEFHYLQRAEDGQAYDDPNTLAHAVIRAAREAGIRIVLLNVAYVNGDVGQPLRPEQRRFNTPDLDAFLHATEQLSRSAAVGVAPHSVRAVPRDWLAPMADFATQHHWPVHMHVSEQPAEVASSERVYGLTPGLIALEAGLAGDRFTAIHGTHLTPEEIARLGATGAQVCACPTTERDLGDGIFAAREWLDAGGRICIGTDSQTVIDPWEEMRSIEYHARLARLRRVVLAREEAGRLEVAPSLLETGCANGARSLRVRSGVLAEQHAADFIAIDLTHPALAGWTPATLPSLLALSAPAQVVTDVWVDGRQVVTDRRHPLLEVAQQRFEVACRRILA